MEMEKEIGKGGILNTANLVTALRIVGTIILIILHCPSVEFTAIYTLTGITDVLDGWIARKTGTAGRFGAKLDSVADLLFYSVMLIKFLPVLRQTLPVAIWYFVAVVLAVRLSAYLVAAIRYRRFASLHTVMNKVTGGAVFLLPYALALSWERIYGWIVVVLAFVSSLEELCIQICRKSYCENVKTIFEKKEI
ncbi:MAG: CDP-alcohol phosphatidyltransferase family protein [Christensenellales bacterium]